MPMDTIPIEGYKVVHPADQERWLDDLLHATVFNQFENHMFSHRYLVLLSNNGISGPEHSEMIIGIPVNRLRVDYALDPKGQAVAYFWKNGEFGRLIPCPVVNRRFQHIHHLNDAISKSLGYKFSNIIADKLLDVDSHYTGSLLLLLLKHLIVLDTSYNGNIGSNLKITPKQFEKIRQVVNERISEKIYTKELAGLLKLSEGYFYEAFKEAAGITPRQYVLSIKVEFAKKLLLKNHPSIIQIGMAIGFDNPANFSRMFKSFTGVSPTEFKKLYKNSG